MKAAIDLDGARPSAMGWEADVGRKAFVDRQVFRYYVRRSNKACEACMPDGGFSDAQFLVLTSLAAGPKHGHAMLGDIEQMSGSRLGPGTLYGAITRLEQQGWIEPLPVDERRKPYRLTAAGRGAFAAKCNTMQRIVNCSAARLAAS